MFNNGELGELHDETSKIKDEQNIKRRVYDALNVLISAGVLKKNAKHVISDQEVYSQHVKIPTKGLKKEDPSTLSLQIASKETSIAEKKQKIE